MVVQLLLLAAPSRSAVNVRCIIIEFQIRNTLGPHVFWRMSWSSGGHCGTIRQLKLGCCCYFDGRLGIKFSFSSEGWTSVKCDWPVCAACFPGKPSIRIIVVNASHGLYKVRLNQFSSPHFVLVTNWRRDSIIKLNGRIQSIHSSCMERKDGVERLAGVATWVGNPNGLTFPVDCPLKNEHAKHNQWSSVCNSDSLMRYPSV
jgi:hypothetical protein